MKQINFRGKKIANEKKSYEECVSYLFYSLYFFQCQRRDCRTYFEVDRFFWFIIYINFQNHLKTVNNDDEIVTFSNAEFDYIL